MLFFSYERNLNIWTPVISNMYFKIFFPNLWLVFCFTKKVFWTAIMLILLKLNLLVLKCFMLFVPDIKIFDKSRIAKGNFFFMEFSWFQDLHLSLCFISTQIFVYGNIYGSSFFFCSSTFFFFSYGELILPSAFVEKTRLSPLCCLYNCGKTIDHLQVVLFWGPMFFSLIYVLSFHLYHTIFSSSFIVTLGIK